MPNILFTYKAFKGARVLLIFLLLGVIFPARAQSRSFLFEIRSPAYKGFILFKEGNYAASIPLLEQAVRSSRYKNDQELWKKLARAYVLTGQAKSGADVYQSLLEKGAELNEEQALLYANALMACGQLEEGRQVLMESLFITGEETKAKKVRETSLSELYRDSIRYSVSPVSVNSEAAEFSPVVLSSGVIFVSDQARTGLLKNRFSVDDSYGLDLFYGKVNKEGDITEVVRLNSLVNTQMFEGPAGLANKEKNLFFTRSDGQGGMKLYQASAIINQQSWGNIQALKLDVSGSAGHPAVTPDGTVIYFVSDMPGGFGGTDLYKVEKTNGGWSTPVNLGSKINTAGNEMFPTLKGNGQLFFSSNGHFGLGGLDIFEATLVADSVREVHNLGAPINSSADDFGLSFHETGDWGYFSSNRVGGAGKDDIYRLNIHYLSLAGTLVDIKNGQGISNASIQLFQENQLLEQVLTDREGNYLFKLFPGQEYELKYLAEDYRPFREIVSTRQGQRYGIKKVENKLERKVKMFVLGTIKTDNHQRAGGATVFVVDQTTGKMDTVLADSRGNYELELDVMSQYTFLAVCEGEASVSTFSTPEKGKASLSYYENIKLAPAKKYQVAGRVKAPMDQKGPFIISRYNELTQITDFLFTDDQGNFSFQAAAVFSYELCLLQGKGRPVILSSGWDKPWREVELSW